MVSMVCMVSMMCMVSVVSVVSIRECVILNHLMVRSPRTLVSRRTPCSLTMLAGGADGPYQYGEWSKSGIQDPTSMFILAGVPRLRDSLFGR
jgi:hypothetical protein